MEKPGGFSSPPPSERDFRTQVDATEQPFEAIVRALAVAEDVEPTALPPLYDVVDPEALNALVDSAPALGSEPRVAVEFSLGEWRIRVTNDGEVTVLEDLASA